MLWRQAHARQQDAKGELGSIPGAWGAMDQAGLAGSNGSRGPGWVSMQRLCKSAL